MSTRARPAISIVGCSVTLGREIVLRDLDLEVAAGEVVAIRGHNGSGKSTLLRAIAGLVMPDAGSVEVFGGPAGARSVPPSVGAAIDAPAPYGWMSARGYLRTLLDLSGVADDGESARALARFGLDGTGAKRTFRFSQGMKKRLALAAASLCSPRLLLLDEPTNALDPDGRMLVAAWIDAARSAGTTVVVATHRAEDEVLCDRSHLLEDGRLRAVGTVEPRAHG